MIWLIGGFLCSAHQLYLGYPIATVTTILLHVYGTVLTVAALGTVQGNGANGAKAAFATLQPVAISALLLLLVLWLKDGVQLWRRKINLQGERVEVCRWHGMAWPAASASYRLPIYISDSPHSTLAALIRSRANFDLPCMAGDR